MEKLTIKGKIDRGDARRGVNQVSQLTGRGLWGSLDMARDQGKWHRTRHQVENLFFHFSFFELEVSRDLIWS